MQREQEHRSKKAAARKITPDGLEERSENIGDTSREAFNLRTERQDVALGRSTRDAPASVHNTIARHKQQTRRFAEHAAQPDDTRAPEAASGKTSDEIIPSRNVTVLSERDETRQNADTPSTEPLRDTERQPLTEQPLSDATAPRSAPERPGRLRFGGSTAAPKDTPRRQPASPDAAKYEPETTAPDAAAPAADSKQPEQASGADATPPPSGTERSKPDKPGKLKFSDDEAAPPAADKPSDKRSGRKLERAQSKAEHSVVKLEKARKNLPKKHTIRRERVFDEKRGKAANKFRLETEVRSQYEHLKGPLITHPPKAGARTATRFAHTKVFQAEHENVGTQAAHKGEMLAEGGLRGVYRLHKTSPYRKVEKLERQTSKLNIKASYQKALHDNPQLKSNPLSRMAQKRKIKKQYAQSAREAKKTGQRLKKTGDVVSRAAQAVVRLVARHPAVFGIIAALFLLVVLISSLFTSCSNIASGIGSSVMAISYVAEDADVDNAELYYTEWETDLQMEISRTASDYLGYDEYRYNIGDISHNPYELMAFLTVMYHDFQYVDVEAVLRQVFAEQYTLTFTPSVETRYADPTDANDDGDYEPYDWHVLTVTLTARSFTDVIYSRLDADQQQQHALLMRSKGGRQYAGSPFDFNWLPYVSSYYGYRVHPTTGAKDYHKGVDIAVPTGADVLAAHNGTVTTGYDAVGYGYYITLTGTNGLVTKYAHLDSFVASDGQTVNAGDVIAKSGNSGNSTGPHLHFEVIKNRQYLNPIYFSQTNDSGNGPVYGYAGSPMGDGSYAALIAEAEKFLGWPYVWGGSSPSTSFDCSGYISWILTQSGVKNTGRLGAQDLYNICTPISPADAQPGDLIFFTGTYSAPKPVTHVGLYVGNGIMLHCGSPIQYTSINTSYWQSHFFSFGRLN